MPGGAPRRSRRDREGHREPGHRRDHRGGHHGRRGQLGRRGRPGRCRRQPGTGHHRRVGSRHSVATALRAGWALVAATGTRRRCATGGRRGQATHALGRGERVLPGRGAPGRAGRGPGLKPDPALAAGSAASSPPSVPVSAAGWTGAWYSGSAGCAVSSSGSGGASTTLRGRGPGLKRGSDRSSATAGSAGAGPARRRGVHRDLGRGSGSLLRGCLLGSLLRRLLLRLGGEVGAVLVLEPLHYGRFDGGAGCFDELTRSLSIDRTSFDGTSYFLASSWTRTLATCFLLVRIPVPSGSCGPLVDVHAHRAVLVREVSSQAHELVLPFCMDAASCCSGAVGARCSLNRSRLSAPRTRASCRRAPRRHVCARRVRDIRSSGAGAPPVRVRCHAGRVRRTRYQLANPDGPPRPSLRRSATTHAWRLALDIRCTSVRDRRCVRGR